MGHSILAIAILVTMTGLVSAFADEKVSLEIPMEADAADTGSSGTANSATTQSLPVMGMNYSGDQDDNSRGDMGRASGRCGKGQHGKGQLGMGHGGGQHGKRGLGKDSDMEQRLDMIEARMSKIEAMLEILIRR